MVCNSAVLRHKINHSRAPPAEPKGAELANEGLWL